MNTQPIILLVDDEESLLEVTSIILEGEGFKTYAADGVKSAMTHLELITPDLIISDITMPELSGYDFFQQVRAMSHLQHIPFVFMTAHSDVENIKRGKELGIDDYLTKPVDVNILLSTIRGKLKRRQMLSDAFSQQIDQMKNQLFKMISHEMRTPLTAILGATEILSESKDNLDPQDFTTFLKMLQASSKRLNNMVEDFLTAMKIESSQIMHEMEYQHVRLNAKLLMDKVLLEHETQIRLRLLDVKNLLPDAAIDIVLYPPHLENILHRLIDNAVKFSPEGGIIELSLTSDDSTCTFIVKDNGCGIPTTQQEQIFQKFQQINRDKNEQQGSGLGLYIAGKLAALNKCKLWFESKEEKGSTFYLKAPKSFSVPE